MEWSSLDAYKNACNGFITRLSYLSKVACESEEDNLVYLTNLD